MRGMSMRDLMSSVPTPNDVDRRVTSAPREQTSLPTTMTSSSHKTSIGFLLAESDGNETESDSEAQRTRRRHNERGQTSAEHQSVGTPRKQAHDDDVTHQHNELATSSLGRVATRKTKRRARVCREPGCDKYVVDHGLCIRHGGGKRCNVEGCNCRAQNRGLCWKHGGFTICTVDGCAKRAKSRGICWSHGGGTRCKQEGCAKIAVSQGLCWAHGGGKRCMVDGCKKPASERTNNLCSDHFVTRSGASTGAAE